MTSAIASRTGAIRASASDRSRPVSLRLAEPCGWPLSSPPLACWRRIVIADVVAVAAGFVVRAIGGGVATGIALSYSFVIVTSACALLIVVGKRYAELVGSGSRPPSRSTLRRYSRRSLRLLLAGAAVLGCVAYASWAFARPGLGTWRALSIVPFVLWLGRYLKTLGAGAGESPEELILHDRPLLALSFVWVALFTAGVYGGT